jgi:replication factor C large subunit
MIARNCDGDVRSAINDLEASLGDLMEKREKEVNIFEVLRAIFHGRNLNDVLKLMDSCDKDVDEIFWWVEENVCKEFTDPRDIAVAFDLLSKADIARSRIAKTQNFRFKNYMKNLIAGIATIGKRTHREFIPYQPPSRIIMLGRTKSVRKKEDELYSKLGKILHCSKRKVKEQMPYLRLILGDKFTGS